MEALRQQTVATPPDLLLQLQDDKQFQFSDGSLQIEARTILAYHHWLKMVLEIWAAQSPVSCERCLQIKVCLGF